MTAERLGPGTPLILPLGLAVGAAVALAVLIVSTRKSDDPARLRDECEIVAAAAASLTPSERGGPPAILTRVGDPEGVMPFKPLDLPSGVNREAIDCAPVMRKALAGETLVAKAGPVQPVRFGRVAMGPGGASAQLVVKLPRGGRLLTLERRGAGWRRVAGQELWRD